jgi:SnoaL-like domain
VQRKTIYGKCASDSGHDEEEILMDASLPQDVLDAADICAVSQLVLLERECRDLGRWDRMRECFHPDSRVRVSWFNGSGAEFVEGSIDMVRRGLLAKHRLGPPVVRLAGHRAVVTLQVIIDIPDKLVGVEVQLSSHARLLFRTEKRDGKWKISFIDSIYMRDELASAIPGQAIPITAAHVKSFRVSYRMLSYLLSLKGYAVNMGLPGDDRPDIVTTLNEEIYSWAQIDP